MVADMSANGLAGRLVRLYLGLAGFGRTSAGSLGENAKITERLKSDCVRFLT